MLSVETYDLVAVDPATSPGGFALLKYVKDNYRWTATLVATHNQEPQFLRQAVKCRIDGLLFRPATSTEFVEQVLLLAEEVNVRRRRQQKRVLAIGAHPDDVEIGCGGALAKHHARYDVLHILTLSRGAAGGDVNMRAVEAHRAAAMVGAHLEMASLRDTDISPGAETISIIEAAIRELHPTHVYTHSLEDTHQDHRAVHAASLVAARRVPNVYCYQTPSSTVDFKPNRFVDITHYIDRKIDLIGAYKSQVDRMDSIQPDVVLSTARYWGRFAGYVLAEPMQIIRQRDGELAADPAKEQAQSQPGWIDG
jgi:LmbE family N-acetylglucosaminyl deacetylase